MIQVEVKLYGALRDFISAEKKGRTTLSLPTAATVQEMLVALGLDHPVLVAVNAEHKSAPTHVLAEGDKVAIFEFTAGG